MSGPVRAAGNPLLELARMRLFDTAVACTLGLKLPEAGDFRTLLGGDLGSRITGLVAATRATEVDDIALSGCVTTGSVVASVALACATELGLPLVAALDAIVDGYEAMIAMAEAVDGARIVYQGVWPTLAAAPAGAVVTAARLMRRDGEAIRDALILATAQTVARPDRNVSRWSLLGRAAAGAVATCQLAALPTGDPQALGNWARTQGFTFAPATLASRAARIGQVDIKLFPTARQGLSAISAFRRLSAHTPPGKHDRVIVAVPGIYAAMIGGSGLPTNRIESLLRVSYQLALAALYPDRLFDVTRVDLPVGEEIQQFLARISVVADPRFDALYPRSWAGEVRLGTIAVETVHDPEGSALAGFGWPELNAKALRLARANHIAPGRFKALEQLIREEGSPQAILTLILGD